jgi:hypothetical protein
MTEPLRLHPDDLDRLADLVADRLAGLVAVPAAPALLTAAQVAQRFGVDRGWVYEHADQLGAVRLGEGARPRLRFAAATVAGALSARQESKRSQVPEPAPRRAPRRRARSTTAAGSPLLPIRGANV